MQIEIQLGLIYVLISYNSERIKFETFTLTGRFGSHGIEHLRPYDSISTSHPSIDLAFARSSAAGSGDRTNQLARSNFSTNLDLAVDR